jgi:hypothetical protein
LKIIPQKRTNSIHFIAICAAIIPIIAALSDCRTVPSSLPKTHGAERFLVDLLWKANGSGFDATMPGISYMLVSSDDGTFSASPADRWPLHLKVRYWEALTRKRTIRAITIIRSTVHDDLVRVEYRITYADGHAGTFRSEITGGVKTPWVLMVYFKDAEEIIR